MGLLEKAKTLKGSHSEDDLHVHDASDVLSLDDFPSFDNEPLVQDLDASEMQEANSEIIADISDAITIENPADVPSGLDAFESSELPSSVDPDFDVKTTDSIEVGGMFDTENFEGTEVLNIDSDDSILNEPRHSAPVKTEDIILDDVSHDDGDRYIASEQENEHIADQSAPVSFDAELDEFLSRDIPDDVFDTTSTLSELQEIVSHDQQENVPGVTGMTVHDLDLVDESDTTSESPSGIDEPVVTAKKPVVNNEDLQIQAEPHLDDEFYAVLLEATRELLRSNSSEEFFNVLLLLIMGQFTSSAAAIILPVDDEEPQGKWTLKDVRGIRLKSRSVTFRGVDPLMGHLLECRDVVDIEEYASLEGFREECSLFYSIGGRYLIPIRAKGLTRAVVSLGDKITGDYTDEEIQNMRRYTVAVSPVFERLRDIEKLIEENRQYVDRNSEYSDIDKIERDLRRSSGSADIDVLIEEKMRHYGCESFCFFVRNERGDFLIPRVCEKEDLMGLKNAGFMIPVDSELSSYFIQKDDWEDVENPATFNPLRSVFSDTHIIKMNLCSIYPFLIRGYISGLLVVMRGKRERVAESKPHIMRLARHVFSFLQGNAAISVYESPFSDIVSKPLLRMDKTISMADDLGITASFILFSVKNIKRYRALFGNADAEQLMIRLREIIESRISHSDYGIRIESGKIIVVLPGKTKRYAVPFATTIRNELGASFRDRDNQIMLSYLIAEYPAEGKNVHEILDYLS